MYKNVCFLFIIFFSLSTFLAMEDPNKNELATFPRFTELPEDLQKLIFTIATQSGDFKDSIENIKKFVLLNKKWQQYFNNPQVLNQLAELLSEKAESFFNPLLPQATLPKFDINNDRERLKIIILSLLGTKQALSNLKQIDPIKVSKDFVYWMKLNKLKYYNDTLGWTILNIIKTLKNLYGKKWITYAWDSSDSKNKKWDFYLFLKNFIKTYPQYYKKLIQLEVLADFRDTMAPLLDPEIISIDFLMDDLKP